MSKGIDYGMGLANVDPITGYRYGVISSHSVGTAWYEDAEADYGEPTCGKCGNAATPHADVAEDTEEWDSALHECADYACLACRYVFGSESAFADEPIGYSFEDDEYTLTDCLDSDIFVLRSPYYTLAVYCSPCVPGAGDLNTPDDDGARTLCLGHEWFEDGKAPYRVFRVSDDAEVLPHD